MLEKSPPNSKNPGMERPLICLSNRGNLDGSRLKRGGEITCPPEWIQLLGECFKSAFAGEGAVSINNPFGGGHIIQNHSRRGTPWIQVEINRNLYLSPPYFDENTLTVSGTRIQELGHKILSALVSFTERITKNRAMVK
jgi:formiminoglutamase